MLTRSAQDSTPVSISQELLLDDSNFIPLRNFQPGNDSYRNTCFIAVVVNLRGLIPAIDQVLALRRRTWKETVLAVRGKWDKKYGYTEEFGGQDDPAELLADILWDVPACR